MTVRELHEFLGGYLSECGDAPVLLREVGYEAAMMPLPELDIESTESGTVAVLATREP
ncbi:hypothetical protein FHX37_4209 [Haloactinospora alba]|uniref:Uncharacterized protein n=1 Tax=Haloactinospora alba TaxID=405555 RepID=A0A543N6N2_9ACTN|nr:hypothetical protein [Haloactinospora alba]TQN27489.1 hypothetical protein FHX37_4209 [Haloactinospora alba]